MRHLLTLAIVLFFAGAAVAAGAADLGSTRALKTDSHIMQNPAADTREGGETIETALPIDALPYYDTGATCDNIHDYDESCPYDGSTSPDVVYSFLATYDALIDIDLFGSFYDTKVFVYENVYTPGAPYACNDDYYDDYTSKIEFMPVFTGNTYFIVVDGYTGDCGEYVLNIGEIYIPEPCELTCDGVAEGEPTLGPGYMDIYNSGCYGEDGDVHFQNLEGDENGDLNFCGISGWLGDESRDTDWFTITIGSSGTVNWTLDAEEETFFFILGPQDCSSVGVLEKYLVTPCSPTVISISGTPGEVVWLWVGPTEYGPPVWFEGNEYDYVMGFEGLQEGVVGVEGVSWGSIKSLYQ